jgi:Ion channel
VLLLWRRFAAALRVALREEDFARVLSAGVLLVLVGTVTYTFGNDWNPVDGFYFAVATLTTSSIADPELVLENGWPKVFTAFYVLLGIGILVEIARRLGMGFIAARAELEAEKHAKQGGGSEPRA